MSTATKLQMSETDTPKYRCGTDEQKKALGVSEDYHLLVGPNGFWTFLGEPENRVWYRDGADAVNELNRLERELTAMTAHEAWQREQWEKMVSHGVGLQNRLQEAKAERDALIAENALTQRACDSWRKMAMDRLDERNALAEEKRALMELLCIIHRDGGHYIQRHGMTKAVIDAELVLYQWRDAYDERVNKSGLMGDT
jgi:hypothetical protein